MYSKEIRSLAYQEEACGDNLLCCILGLRDLQTRIYWLISENEMETADIAKKIDRDRTSIQRALQDLITVGLVTRTSLPVKKGRKFAYKGVSIDKLKHKLNQVADEYHEKIKNDIRNLKSRS